MALSAGARLGGYEILAGLGAGGMGEVFRARDTRLGREVAIKTILDAFTHDVDRVARFQREAKVLASVNHPHIAALYGLEQAEGQHFLVLELVEGQTIADRLLRGPLPPADAIRLATQIAEALEAAHERGIVHRDLKPANVKVTPDNSVKVLDFGLAKAAESEVASSNAANSPTLSMMASQAGVILGTAAYMSPEQAKGLPADHRSDIFSFGSVLFEMLTGRQAFNGDNPAEVLASVLIRDPEIGLLPPNLNPRLVDLLRRCLEKQPKRRWQAIGDVRAELEAIAAQPYAAPAPMAIHQKHRLARRIAFAALWIAVGAAAASALWISRPAAPRPAVRFSMRLPEGQRFSEQGRYLLAMAPDGGAIAYGANNRLFVHALSSLEPRPVPGTETPRGISSPAFSPDGQSVAYYSVSDRTIKRVPIGGGTPMTICSAAPPYGLSWSAGYLYIGQSEPGKRGIVRVRDSGGAPETVVTLGDAEIPDAPRLLPDGDTLLFAVATRGPVGRSIWDTARIMAHSMRSRTPKILVEGGSSPVYVESGHLVYAMSGSLMAVPFDLARVEVRGKAVPVLEGVRRSTGAVTGSADFVVSGTGVAAYVPGPASRGLEQVDLGLVDSDGRLQPLGLPPGPFRTPRASPDGARVAFFSDDGRDAYIATYVLAGGSAIRRVTFSGKDRFPVWHPDNKRLAFQSARHGDAGIFWQPADGGDAERLTTAAEGESHAPRAWSRDGGTLLFDIVRGESASLHAFTLKDRKTAPVAGIVSGAPVTAAALSPDGRWLAYTLVGLGMSSKTYVEPFPPTGAKYQVPTDGAHAPVWSADGKTLYYIPAPSEFEGVAVTTSPAVSFGHPFTVQRPFAGVSPRGARSYDMVRDGRFVAIVTPGQPNTTGGTVAVNMINVILNWVDELNARLPK